MKKRQVFKKFTFLYHFRSDIKAIISKNNKVHFRKVNTKWKIPIDDIT